MSEDNWRSWERDPPCYNQEVEMKRGPGGTVERIMPGDARQSSLWNVSEVYWRYASPPPKPSLKAIHATLDHARDVIVAVLSGGFGDLSMDTIFALGETVGQITKAKALVGRDIDDLKAKGETR